MDVTIYCDDNQYCGDTWEQNYVKLYFLIRKGNDYVYE